MRRPGDGRLDALEPLIVDATARRWIAAGADRAPERLVAEVLGALAATEQEAPRRWWRPALPAGAAFRPVAAGLALVLAGVAAMAAAGGPDGLRRAAIGLLAGTCEDDRLLQTYVASTETARRGVLSGAGFTGPTALAMAPDGTLVVADDSGVVLRIPATGPAETIAVPEADADAATPGVARIGFPAGLAVAADGTLAVLDGPAHRVVRIDPDGRTTTVAGTGENGTNGDGGRATDARIAAWAMSSGPDGTLYLAEPSRYRAVDPQGTIRAFAGTGAPGWSGDGGPATDAALLHTGQIAVAADGRVFLEDQARVRVVYEGGIIDTFAGTGSTGTPLDGVLAWKSPLVSLGAMTVDPVGRLFLVDGNAVRMVDRDETIRTVAGGLQPGTGPDCGDPLGATLDSPSGLAFHDGMLYIADTGNGRIARVRP